MVTPLARDRARARGIKLERMPLMLKATVIGRVWSTKHLADVPSGPVLEVRVDDAGASLLAFDPLGCGEGER